MFQTATFTKSPAKTLGSPSSSYETTTTTTVTKKPLLSPQKKSFVREISNSDGSQIQEKETLDTEVSEKKTTIEDSPVRNGNKETYRTTTITEKEEKIHKTQVKEPLTLKICSEKRSAQHFITAVSSRKI